MLAFLAVAAIVIVSPGPDFALTVPPGWRVQVVDSGQDTATGSRVLRCLASVQAQFLIYLPNPIAARLGFVTEMTPAHLDEIARHIADFSLAGIPTKLEVSRHGFVIGVNYKY